MNDLKALIGDENVKCVEHVKKYERPVYKTPNIVQITPCYQEIYGVFKDESTLEETKQKVVAFALCDDGCVYPMLYDSDVFGLYKVLTLGYILGKRAERARRKGRAQ